MTTFFVATGDDVVRLRSANGVNGRWESAPVLTGVGVQCLAVDPHNSRRVYAGTFDEGLYRTNDDGESWQRVGKELPHQRFLSVAISPSHRTNGVSAVYAGAEPSALFRSEDDGASWQELPNLATLPSAPTWSFPPRPWTSHVRWITPSWSNPDLLFAGIELGGVMRSVDGGVTWEDRKPGSYHDSHCIRTHPADGSRVYEAAGGGVAASRDHGDSWHETDGGMDRNYAWALAVDPADPDLWYVSASPSARYAHHLDNDARADIFRKRGEHDWEILGGGLPNPMNVMPYALLTPVDRPGEVFAGMRDGTIYHSSDQGDTWTPLDVQLPGLLAFDNAVE